MRKFLLTSVLAAMVAVVVAPGIGAAGGRPVVTKIDSTRTGKLCGYAGTYHDVGVDVFSLANNVFFDRYSIHTTFTSNAGVVVLLFAAGTVSGNDTLISNGDGTFTATATYKGLPEQIKLPGGGVLTRDAGIITFVDILAPDGQGGFDLVSEQVSMRGPHPEVDSGFNLACDILGPALAAG